MYNQYNIMSDVFYILYCYNKYKYFILYYTEYLKLSTYFTLTAQFMLKIFID